MRSSCTVCMFMYLKDYHQLLVNFLNATELQNALKTESETLVPLKTTNDQLVFAQQC